MRRDIRGGALVAEPGSLAAWHLLQVSWGRRSASDPQAQDGGRQEAEASSRPAEPERLFEDSWTAARDRRTTRRPARNPLPKLSVRERKALKGAAGRRSSSAGRYGSSGREISLAETSRSGSAPGTGGSSLHSSAFAGGRRRERPELCGQRLCLPRPFGSGPACPAASGDGITPKSLSFSELLRRQRRVRGRGLCRRGSGLWRARGDFFPSLSRRGRPLQMMRRRSRRRTCWHS